MQRRSWLMILSLIALLLPVARKASATPPDKPSAASAQAAAVVDKELVKPLTAKEEKQDRFSRSYIPPHARRLRVLDTPRATDSRGAEFLTFAVDERSGRFAHRPADDPAGWRTDAIVGCVYPARGEVFIKRGDKFFGAGLLLGHRTPAADEAVCHAAPARTAQN